MRLIIPFHPQWSSLVSDIFLMKDVKLPKELAEIHAVKLYEPDGEEQLDKGLRYLLNDKAALNN